MTNNKVLENEYFRLNREKNRCLLELKHLPKGYLSKKKINGHDYFYLQKIENGKIKSQYVSSENVPSLQSQIETRRRLEIYKRELTKDIKSFGNILKIPKDDPRLTSLYSIEEIQKISLPVFESNNVKKAFLFGSYYSNSATPNSDIDILVDSGLKGLDFFGLLEDLSCLFLVPIDLIDVRQLKDNSEFTKNIYNNMIQIYG